ncbi:MAG: hypothetical protein RL033_4589 [Pseudomonadota bacterium]|jgi:CubicO group peptidase (beta-lactamase class C family)
MSHVDHRPSFQGCAVRCALGVPGRALLVAGRALLVLLLCSAAASTASGAPLDEYARDWAERYDVSGSWRLQRGDVVLAEGARGSTGHDLPPFTSDTPSWIGSNSKQFASAAVLRLVEQGRVELAAPLTRYFPELKPEAVTRGDSTCSIEHVLSHRCGLMRDAGLHGDAHLSSAAGEADLLGAINDAQPSFAPGSAYEYSNVGYALLGLLVQRVSGQGYEQFLQEQFWGPLGMTHTGIRPREGLQVAHGQLAALLVWVDAHRWFPVAFDVVQGRIGAAGNVYSTARDLAIWTHALHGGKVLSPASWAEMTRPRGDDYALGLVVREVAPLGKLIYHNGWIGSHGLSSWAAYLPEQDLTAVVLANRPLEAGRSQALVDALLRKASGQPEKPPTGSAFLLLLKSSGPMALVALTQALVFGLAPLCILLSLWMMLRRVRRPEGFDRQNWWLSYHLYAVFLSTWIPEHLWPLLPVWGAVVLAGVYRSRFWQLPGGLLSNRHGGPATPPYRALVLRSLALLGLFALCAWDSDLHRTSLAQAGLLLAELCLWLALARQQGASSDAAALRRS